MSDGRKRQEPGSADRPSITPDVAAFGPAAATAWIEMLNESARFVADRLWKDLEVQQAILQCRTPDELVRVQSEFLRDGFEQYSKEALRMVEMTRKATEAVVNETLSGYSRRFDDVPL